MVCLLLSVQAVVLGVAALTQHPVLATTTTSTRDYAAACTALSSKITTLIPGHHVYNVQNGILPKGSTFSNGTFDYATPVTDLPELCRFGAYFNTSYKSSVKFEIWMPTTTWNGRFAFVGNGIDAGAVNYPSMGGAVSNYGFAAASDDNGHEESGIFGEWRANNTESQIDFGSRGVHLSTVFSKNVLEAFYGTPEKSYNSYWLGCSSGGKQGLKEIQMYPEDYDGVLAGSPAWWWSHLTGYTALGPLLNPTGPGYVNYSDFSQLHASIISQCDAIDGLTDGIIANPARCQIDWKKTGLSTAQQKQAQQFYANWTEPSGKLIFPAFSLGAEETGLAGIIGGAFPFTLDYFKYQVLNFTSVQAASNFTITDPKILARYVEIADKTNPGGSTADNYNISPYFKRGGKLIHYVGTADQLIPYGSSLVYHQRVRQTVGSSTDASYRLYPVPGMGHCSGGSRTTDNFGGDPGMSGVSPSTMSPSGNAIMALIQWVEHGAAPNTITATGTGISRPLCPYPKFPKYVNGNTTLASSFICQ